IPFICPGFKHAERNFDIGPMFVETLRVELFPSGKTFKPDRNSHQQLIWITCGNRTFGLTLDDELPHRFSEDLCLPLHLFEQVGGSLLRTSYLIEKLIEFGVETPAFHQA